MDSISQIGGNDDDSGAGPTGGLDLKNVGAELSKRDKKITDLLSDRTKLKNLLKKAKSAIDSINKKYRTAQDNEKSMDSKLQNALEKNKDLVQTLEIIQK